MLFSMWRDAGEDLKVDDPDLQKSLAPFHLLEEEGKLALPIIQKSGEDDLYELSIEMAEKKKRTTTKKKADTMRRPLAKTKAVAKKVPKLKKKTTFPRFVVGCVPRKNNVNKYVY